MLAWRGARVERNIVQAREWILTALVILLPLVIATGVTLWSLEQRRYRPKKRRANVPRETEGRGKQVVAGADADAA
jgi:hypothetical protein